MATQPHGEASFPAKVFRFSCSPAARPFGAGEARRLRLEDMNKKERVLEEMGWGPTL